MIGRDLALARKAAGLSQTALARKAGIGRHAVSYWECRAKVDPRSWAVQRMAEAEPHITALLTAPIRGTFGLLCTSTHPRDMTVSQATPESLPHFPLIKARVGGWGVSVFDRLDAQIEEKLSVMMEREAQRRARRRVICNAKTRKGTPCRNKSEPGKARCKFHGGMSTGPQTPEGRERIAEAQRRRWARWRASLAGSQVTRCP